MHAFCSQSYYIVRGYYKAWEGYKAWKNKFCQDSPLTLYLRDY